MRYFSDCITKKLGGNRVKNGGQSHFHISDLFVLCSSLTTYLIRFSVFCVCVFFVFYHTNFCSNPTIFQFHHNIYHNIYHKFYHIFYHKLLPQTTIIIGVSISTTTPIFVPIQQFFNFTTNFTMHLNTYFTKNFTTNYYHKPLS